MNQLSFTSPKGREYVIRDIQPQDTDLLVDLFYHLTPETIYRRFHTTIDPQTVPLEHIRQVAGQLARIDPDCDVALLALHQDQAVGVARFHRIQGTTDAESAIVVRDDYQREGLGTHLLELLRARAQEKGVTHLIALVLAQNNPITQVVRQSGLKSKWRFEQGESYLEVDITSPEVPAAD
jgi:acetyltransferase